MNSSGLDRPNPFPGLRPFRSDEHHLFFGREEQTAALLQLLRKNRFLAVVGTSGSGKSSLVRAGMIAELYGGTMTHAGSTWEVIILRPGGSPIENLARGMVESDLYDAEDPSTLARLKATLSRSRFGLVEAMKQSEVFEPGSNLLVVVDQFEELFRFRQQGVDSEEAATAFVNLLLTASEQQECPIYIAITMRSDYLGDCSEIPGLAEAVNEGEYLIPRLLRDQKRDAIEKPIGVGGAKISPLLVQRLLNDVGDDPDQLPVLQHALMRMWDVWAADHHHDRPIAVSDFEATGGLTTALSNHADELFDSLPDDRHRLACEKLFKSLTEKGEDNRGIRRPTRLAALQAITGMDRETLCTVLDAFRRTGVTFLMPGIETEIGERTVIDLSHESLMRGWQRLRTWVDEEAQSARIFRRLLDTARLWSDGKASLFRDPDLQIALSWRDEEHPNAEWSEQYGGQSEVAIGFLEKSEKAVQAERQAKEDARKHELEQAQQLAEARQQRLEQQQRGARKLRAILAGLAVVAVVAVVACFVALAANNKANELAGIAGREADNARQHAAATQTALTDVELEKTRAEGLLRKSIIAEKSALDAEQRSRVFRYATDIQLAATLAADSTSNAGQVLARLSDHDPDENKGQDGKEDLRGFEWYYLKQLAGGRGSVIKGFGKEIVDMILAPNGELMTLTRDSRLQFRNPETRLEMRPALDLKKGRPIGAQALSRDGRQVALAVGSQVSLVDTATGHELARTIPSATRGGLMFSPDSRMVITVDTGVGWWDTATAKPIATQESKLNVIRDNPIPMSVSADGLTLAVGGQGSYRGTFFVFRMNPQTREVTTLASNAGEGGTKRALAISPDGKTVAVSMFFQGTIAFYDATGKLLHKDVAAHSASISSIAYNSNGTELATASMEGTIKIWKDIEKLDPANAISLMGHSDQVLALAYVPGEQRLLSAGNDKSVRLWDLDQNRSSLHRVIARDQGPRARYSPDGTLIATSKESSLRLLDAATAKVVLQLPPRSDGLSANSVAFSPDGHLLAAGFSGTKDVSFIELWDLDRREKLAELPGTTTIPGYATTETSGVVGTLEFSPDGKQLVAGFGVQHILSWGDRGNHPMLVYDVAARRVIRRLEGHRNTCVSVKFSADGTRLASASMDGTARIWNAASWQELHVLHNPDVPTDLGQVRVYDVAFSPDGKLLAMASAEGHVIIWDARTGEQLQTLRGHSNEVWAVAFSPNGLTLASGSIDNTVRLWNVATWRELMRLDPKESFDARALDFSPDGSRLLGGSFRGGTIEWSVQSSSVQSGPLANQVTGWLQPRFDFQSRVRMHSESLKLFESLEPLAQLHPDNAAVQAALAATRANWHASRQEWKLAADQFDRLQRFDPTTPDAWLRTPGRLRLVTALLHQDRPADAAVLLTGGEKRRVNEGNGSRSVSFGFEAARDQFPLKVTHVYRGTSAWRAGLRAGDRLLKFNDVELTAQTLSDYAKLTGEGTRVRLTIQHPGQDPETVDVTSTSHIQDDVTVEQMETLLAVVDQKLAEAPNQLGLLELHAELAGQSSDSGRQVADWTAAITALESQDPQQTTALQRFYRRRGDAYAQLKKWQAALDDYSKGITAEGVLDNQARAQAAPLLNSGAVVPNSEWDGTPWLYTTVKPADDWNQAGFNDDAWLRGEGPFGTQDFPSSRTSWTTPDIWLRYDFELPEGANASAHQLRILCDDIAGIYLNGKHIYHREGHTQLKYINVELAPDVVGPLLPGRNVLAIHSINLSAIGYIDVGLYAGSTAARRNELLGSGVISLSGDPWQLLSTAYFLQNDLPAIDRLVESRPRSAGMVGDLFTRGETKDWQKAVDIYSKGILAATADPELLSRRAAAYEELKNWDAAAADWSRVAGQNPPGAKLLVDFADRLARVEQHDLAATQRQRARQVLEATLQADPGDDPATDSLAQLVLDMASPKEPTWTTIKPAASKTDGGAALVLQKDQSVLIEEGQDTIALPVTGRLPSAIRIETSPNAQPSAAGEVPFKEYRIVSTRPPTEVLRGRYVRIDLPGDNRQFPRHSDDGTDKIINLSELQVFQGDKNIALNKAATASSRYDTNRTTPDKAVDGNTAGNDTTNSYVHTKSGDKDPWWEVDLGSEQVIDRMVVWNRTEGNLPNRMNHFRVRVLDSSRKVLYEEVIDSAPRLSREIRPRSVQVVKVTPDAAGDASPWQVRFNNRDGAPRWKRFRISTTEQPLMLNTIVYTSDLKWELLEPSKLTPAEGTKIDVQPDGSFVADVADPGELILPQLPDSTRAIRFESTRSARSGTAALSEYRIQAFSAADPKLAVPRGRYLRIDLPFDQKKFPRRLLEATAKAKVLSLAEVQVFQGEENVALAQPARQSSTYGSNTAGKAVAERAVDGRTDGAYSSRSVTHTDHGTDKNPWWEVDLGEEKSIDRIVLWNRTDADHQRMNHFRILIMDETRQVVFEQMFDDAPRPSLEIDCRSMVVAKSPEPDVAKPQWSLRLDPKTGPRRIRISTADRLPTPILSIDSTGLTWSAPVATQESETGRKLVAQSDGSYVVASRADSLPLPVLPDAVKAIRIESAPKSGSQPDQANVFQEYRIQAVGASSTESGKVHGRYVRLDLPGDTRQFPRYPADKTRKVINLPEFQVFQGDQNIAFRKKCRMSSTLNDEHAADAAVDGLTAVGQNQFAQTQLESAPWWEVDLGTEESIDRIVVWNHDHPELSKRLNHFRVRILDAATNVVFEQVIDAAPKPSLEISCRSIFARSIPLTADVKPHWSMSLNDDTGIDPLQRFRISTAVTTYSLEQENTHAEARKITLPAARLAAAYDLSSQPTVSADWFGRALDNATSDLSRKAVLTPLQGHTGALAELLKRRPDDVDLQLAMARNWIAEGMLKLARAQPSPALNSFQQASVIFTRLLAQNPEPEWTVITPTDPKSAGGATLTLKPDGSILASGENPDEDTYIITAAAGLDRIAAFRLETLPDPSLPKNGPGRFESNGNFHVNEIRIWTRESAVALSNIVVTHGETEGYRRVIDGNVDPVNYWSNSPKPGQANTAVLASRTPIPGSGPLRFELVFSRSAAKRHNLGRFRISATSDPRAFEASRLRIAVSPAELATLDVALGRAFAELGRISEAAAAIARGLDRIGDEEARGKLIEQFQEHLAPLTLLAEQRPKDLTLQIALAKHLSVSGKKALAQNRQDEALPQLAQARELFSRLATDHPDSTWTVLQPIEMTSEQGAVLTQEADGSIFAEGEISTLDNYSIVAAVPRAGFTAVRLEAIPDVRLPRGGSGRGYNYGEFLLSEFEAVIATPDNVSEQPLTISRIYADYSRDTNPASNAIDSDESTAWSVSPKVREPHAAIFLLGAPLPPGESTQFLHVRLKSGSRLLPSCHLGRFRLSLTSDPNAIEVAQFHQELNASGVADLGRSLGNAHGRQGRVDQAATAFHQALDLAADRDGRMKILKEASAYAGVLDKLAKLRSDDAAVLDALSRHFQQRGDIASARAAAAKARTLYEQQLAAEPARVKLAKDLGDLLLDVSSAEWMTRNWTILKPTDMNSLAGATLTILDDGSILAGGRAESSEVYTITTKAGLPGIQAFLLEAIPHESLPKGSSGRRADGNFALTGFKITQSADGSAGSSTAVPLTMAICDYSQSHSPVKNVLDSNDETFWDILPHIGQPHYAAFAPATPLTASAEGFLTFTLEFKFNQPLGLGRFRLSATDNSEAFAEEKARLQALKIENPWLRLGMAYHALREDDRAVDAFVRAVELTGSARARAAVAQEAAVSDNLFSRLRERFPNDQSLLLGQAKYVATKLVAEDQFQAAVNLLSGILADFPDDIELRNLRAGAQMKRANWKAADADYVRVIDLETDSGRRRAAERTRAEIQLRLWQIQAGAETYLQEMLLTPDYYRMRDAIVAEMFAGNPEIARTAARRLYEKHYFTRDASEARWQVRMFTSLPGLVTKDNHQRLLVLAKTSATWTEAMTAAIHYRLGDLAQAEPLLTMSPGEQEFQALGAMLLYDRGEIDKARALLSVMTNWMNGERSKDPENAVPSQHDWQQWSLRTAVWREATRKFIGPRLTELDKQLARQPDTTELLLERARLLADAGLNEEAIRDLDRLVTLKVDSAEAHALRGRVLAGLNRGDEALQHLSQAIAAGAQEASVHAARGAILLKRNQLEQARADLERSLDLGPTELAARSLADLLLAEAQLATHWSVLKPTEMQSEGGATFTILDDGSLLVGGPNVIGDGYLIRTIIPHASRMSVLRLEALTHESLPNQGPGRDEQRDRGNFAITGLEVRADVAGNDSVSVPLSDVTADFSWYKLQVNHWNIGGQAGRPHTAYYLVAPPVELGDETRLEFRMRFSPNTDWPRQNLGRFRLSISDDPRAFAREQTRFAALKSSSPWIRLANVQLLNPESGRAVDNFVRGFQLSTDDAERLALVEHLATNNAISPDFLKRLNADPQLHLILGNRFAADGQWDQADAAYREAVRLNPGVIPDWISSGFRRMDPYPGGLDTPYPPESSPDPFVAVARAGSDGTMVRIPWKPVTPDSDGRFALGNELGCQYVLTRVWSPVVQEVALQVGDDDLMRLHLNDRVLFQSTANGGSAVPKEHEVAGTLQTGWNTILVKVENRSGASALILTLSRKPQDLIAARAGNRLFQAQQLVAAGQTDEAVVRFTELIAEFPKDVRVYVARAEAYSKLSQWESAATDWASADQHAPDKKVKYGNPPTYCLDQRARIFERLKQYDRQAQALTELMKPENLGENAASLSGRAGAYDKLRKWDLARFDHNQAIEMAPLPDRGGNLASRARHFALQGLWTQAAEDMREIYQNLPNPSQGSGTLRDAALVFAMASDLKNYRTLVNQLYGKLAANPSADECKWTVLTMILVPDTITGDNRARLLEVAAQADNYWKPRLTAAIHFRSGDPRAAAEFFRANTGVTPFLFLRAMAEHQTGNTDLARKLLEEGNSLIQAQRDKDPGAGVPQSINWQDWATLIPLQYEASDLILGTVDSTPKQLAELGQTQRAASAYARLLAETVDRDARSRIIDELTRFDGVVQELHVRLRNEPAIQAAYLRVIEKVATDFNRKLDELAQMEDTQASQSSLIATVVSRQDGVIDSLLKLRPDDTLLKSVYAVLSGDWKNAAADFSQLTEQNEMADSIAWMTPVAMWAYAGDAERHREFSEKMYERYRDSTSLNDLERYMKVTLVFKNGPKIPPEVVTKLTANVAVNGLWYHSSLALHDCRRGDYAQAHKHLDEAFVLETKSPNGYAKALAMAIRSLTYASQQDVARARQSLDQLKQGMVYDLKLGWNDNGLLTGRTVLSGASIQNDKLIPEILRRETEQLIQSIAAGQPK